MLWTLIKATPCALLSNGLNDLNVLNGWNFFQYKEPENE